jgi:Mg-chelatase subunit ChlD
MRRAEVSIPGDERERRWRLILGAESEDRNAAGGSGDGLSGDDPAIDNALAQLYGGDGPSRDRKGSLGGSAPNVARWLGDIRRYFPASIVRVMQQDAIERLNLRQLLLEPELLDAVVPDVHLVATLITLNQAMPTETRDTARRVVDQVVQDLMRRLASKMRQAVQGSLNRATRNRHPRHNEMDWHRTIRSNLKHYQPSYRTVVPEQRIGFGRRRSSLRDLILCIDQSGSMATSVVYASIFGAVLASLPSLTTRLVAFDTSVADLSDQLQDPVDVLFGAQLGGGTDINRALAYCEDLIRRPTETILVLISDLYEGGNRDEMVRRAAALAGAGVQMIALLALNDDGAPSYDHGVAATFAASGIPTFACTPDLFPELMAAAINRHDIEAWAARQAIVTARAQPPE